MNTGYIVSADEHAAFDRDGALPLRAVIDNDFLARMQLASDRARDYPGGFWYKIYLWRRDPDFRDCCFNSPLPAIAAQLLESDKVNLLYDQLFVKPPAGDVTPWHHDLPYWPVEGSAVLSIWLALSDVTDANGGLEFIRGSHHWPQRFHPFTTDENGTYHETHPDKNDDYQEMPDFDLERDDYEIIKWDLNAGDAVVFHSLTLHHAGANSNTRHARKGYALRFTGEEVRYRTGPSMNEHVFNPELKTGDVMDSEQYPVVFQQRA